MSKRFAVLFSVLMIVSLVLASCAQQNTPAPSETQAMEETQAVEETQAMEETQAPQGDAVPAECADNADEKVCAVFAPGDTVKIGYAGPMTGDYSAFGIDISQGGQVAVEKFGEVDGWTIELLVEDTQGSPEGGASVANLYVSNPDVVAISGHTFSGSTASAIPIYNEARIPMLSASATRADLTQGDQDVFNRIPFTDDIQGTSAAEYLYNTLGFRTIAAMHDGDAYGQGLAEKVQQVFTDLGGEVVAFQAITAGETDYTAPLTDISAQSPEAIYYGGYYPEAAVIANNMPVAGLPDAVLFSDDGVFGATYIELAGDNAEGTYATSALPPASEARDEFTATYMEQYGVEPGSLSTFTWHGYDVVSALISVINDVAVVGGDGNLYINREAMVSGVRGLSGFQGLTGEISCNAEGECNTAGPTFFVVENGEWVEAPK
ncbi:MAG: branched-chain amino acid ABC transporter substrate-binding protein [Anaerolineales bacterium]|jgi:branched-chain amino acid transport system substrate-binding protein